MMKIVNLYKNGADTPYEYKISSCKILIEVGFFRDAQDLLTELSETVEDVADVWYLLGLANKGRKDFSTATECLKRAMEIAIEQNEDKDFIKEINKEGEFCSNQEDEFVPDKDEEIDEDDEWITDDEDIMDEMK